MLSLKKNKEINTGGGDSIEVGFRSSWKDHKSSKLHSANGPTTKGVYATLGPVSTGFQQPAAPISLNGDKQCNWLVCS
jgi:hypothetical protein